MSAGRICTREIFTADAGETIVAAALRMTEEEVGALLVVDGEGRPIGILTDRDIVTRVVAAGLDTATCPVSRTMTADPATIGEEASIDEAIEVMKRNSCKRLPVVDAEGRVSGILTMTDVVDSVADRMAAIRGFLYKDLP